MGWSCLGLNSYSYLLACSALDKEKNIIQNKKEEKQNGGAGILKTFFGT